VATAIINESNFVAILGNMTSQVDRDFAVDYNHMSISRSPTLIPSGFSLCPFLLFVVRCLLVLIFSIFFLSLSLLMRGARILFIGGKCYDLPIR
jgi:hypothetical protein